MGLELLVLDLLKSYRGRVVVGLGMVAVAMFLWLLSYPQLRDARALKAGGRRVVAEVIDARISSGPHGIGKHYDIRYRFRLQPGAGPAWYTQSENGPLARNELWSTLPKDQWEQATRTFMVEVDYLPGDPSVNCLAGRAGKELTGAYALVSFAALMGIPGALMIAHGIYRLVVPPQAPRLEPLRRDGAQC